MFSHVLWRGILADSLRLCVCVFACQLNAIPDFFFYLFFFLTHHTFVSVHCDHYSVCGGIWAYVLMNDMCDMCCLPGIPVTSSIGPAPIEMAYQWRYIWKNSLPMQSLLAYIIPSQTERDRYPYRVMLIFPCILFLPPSPLFPLSISVLSWRYANRCVSISCQIITIY